MYQKEKEKSRATNARLFLSFYRIFELARHCCCRAAHFLFAVLPPRYRTPLYPPVISPLAQNCYTLNLSLVLKQSYRRVCTLRISFIFHIVSRARITRQDLVGSFRSKEKRERELQRSVSCSRIYRFSTRTNKLTKRCRKDCGSGSRSGSKKLIIIPRWG